MSGNHRGRDSSLGHSLFLVFMWGVVILGVVVSIVPSVRNRIASSGQNASRRVEEVFQPFLDDGDVSVNHATNKSNASMDTAAGQDTDTCEHLNVRHGRPSWLAAGPPPALTDQSSALASSVVHPTPTRWTPAATSAECEGELMCLLDHVAHGGAPIQPGIIVSFPQATPPPPSSPTAPSISKLSPTMS